MLQSKDSIEALKHHAGWKAFQEYYTEVLRSNESALLSGYVNKDGRDISDILRGKIMMLLEITNSHKSIADYETLAVEVEANRDKDESNKGA